jgi:hypothetical protein
MANLKSIKRSFVLLSILISGYHMQGQTELLSNYRWKNRLLLIFDSAKHSQQCISQIELLGALDGEFKERKLLVFLITNEGCRQLNKEEVTTEKCTILRTLKSDVAIFSVQLVGLDGGIKFSRNKPVTREELFVLIDAMPMRKNEINQQHKENN